MRRAPFRVIPSVDILDGRAVRLVRGNFQDVTVYGDPVDLAKSWGAAPGTLVHVVDLEGSRRGAPTAFGTVERLAALGFTVQAGGGIRSAADAAAWVASGASRVVVGTAAAANDGRLAEIVDAVGAERVVPAVDLRNGEIRVEGWERRAALSASDVFERIRASGIREVLITDIGVDGTMQGPSLDLYRALASQTDLSIIASGGVGTMTDLVALARLSNVSGVVIGKALHEGRIGYREAADRVTQSELPPRVIPCLDIRGGRVVKGVRFEGLRDAGDPIEQARRYEAEGADEICVLDVSATTEERAASLDVIRAISETLFIPLSVGGGVRSVGDFRSLLRAGADRVAINTAALREPELIARCAREFGRQAVVLSCDARRNGDGYRAVARSGTDTTDVDAVAWCARAEELGAGEILLTSVDRDGTENGFDVGLLRAVTAKVRIGVIASGGAGRVEHFAEAIERGGASAVLAASLFHDRKLSVGDVKEYLGGRGIPVRKFSPLPVATFRAEARGHCRGEGNTGGSMIDIKSLTFDDRGLVAAIVRDSATREVLMLAWMNRESLARTLESGETWFWSRSRNELWHKGSTSGNTQHVVAIRKDCDGDALLVDVVPAGPACHTGERSCFGDSRAAGLDLAPLYAVLASRRENAPEGSYSAKLFGSGRERIVKKIGEEATEVVIAGMGNERSRIVEETADLLFHLSVLLVDEGISLEEIGAELTSREGKRRGS